MEPAIRIVQSTPQMRMDEFVQATKRYTAGGKERVLRHVDFLTSTRDKAASMGVGIIPLCVVWGAKEGFKLGKKLAALVDKEDKCKLPQVGGMIGGLGGGAVGTFVYMKGVEKVSDKFEKWRESSLDANLTEIIDKIYPQDAILQAHLCAISLKIPLLPVKIPNCKEVFDCDEVSKLPRLGAEEGMSEAEKQALPIQHPLRHALKGEPIETFQPDAIKVDYRTAILIEKRIRHLVQQDVAELPATSPLRASVDTVVSRLNVKIQKCYREVLGDLGRRMAEAQDSAEAEALQQEQSRFFETYGRTFMEDPFLPRV